MGSLSDLPDDAPIWAEPDEGGWMIVADVEPGEISPERVRQAIDRQREQTRLQQQVAQAWADAFPPVAFSADQRTSGWFAMERPQEPFQDHEQYAFTWVPSLDLWGFGLALHEWHMIEHEGTVTIRLDDGSVVRHPGQVHDRVRDLVLPGRPSSRLEAAGETEFDGRAVGEFVATEPARGPKLGRVFTILVDKTTNLVVRSSSDEGAWAAVQRLEVTADGLELLDHPLLIAEATAVRVGHVIVHDARSPDDEVHVHWGLSLEGLPSASLDTSAAPSVSIAATIEWAREVAVSCSRWVDHPRGYQRIF